MIHCVIPKIAIANRAIKRKIEERILSILHGIGRASSALSISLVLNDLGSIWRKIFKQ
jgi:hypothetical protein